MAATFSPVAALTITTATLTDGNGQMSAHVDNSSDEYQRIHLYIRMETGTSPTVGKTFEIYGVRQDDHTGIEYVSDGYGTSGAAISATPPNAQFIGAIVVTATSDTMVYGEFVWEDPGPGGWGIIVMNETGASSSTNEDDGFVHWVGEKA